MNRSILVLVWLPVAACYSPDHSNLEMESEDGTSAATESAVSQTSSAGDSMDSGVSAGSTTSTTGASGATMTSTSGTTAASTTVDPTGDTTTGESVQPSTWRIDTIEIRDPHVFVSPLGDVTQSQVNPALNDGLHMDMDDPPDNVLDMGVALRLDPNESDDGTGYFSLANAECTAPVDTTSCELMGGTTEYTAAYTSRTTGTCLEADAVSLTDYADPPEHPLPTLAPCFVTAAADMVIIADYLTLPMTAAIVSAQYVGDPATGLIEGNIHGFITLEDAMDTFVDVPVLGSTPLSDMFRDDDLDFGGDGWMMHISFTAVPVDYE